MAGQLHIPDEKVMVDGTSFLPSQDYASKAMPPILGTIDMMVIYILIVFFITNVPFAIVGGVSTFTYWVLAGVVFFVPCVIATAQLGVLFPYEGSLYNWTHHLFGGYWSFFVAFCAWFPGVLVIVTGADTFVTFVQGLNSHWLVEFWQQWLVILVIIAFSAFLSIQPFRMVSNVANIVVCLIVVAVLIVGIAGVVWVAGGHPSATNFQRLSDWNISPTNIFVFGFVAQAYLGFEVPLNMSGELRGRGERKGRATITRHLLWGTAFIVFSYLIVTFAELVTQGGAAASTTGNFSLITTVDMVLGKFMGNVVVVCIMCFFVLVPAVYNYGFARLLFVAGIDQRLPQVMGRLNKHRVPANAILFQATIAAIFATIFFIAVPYGIHIGNSSDLTTQVYAIDQASATLIWTISTAFLFFNLIKLVWRYRATLQKKLVVPKPVLWACIVIGPLACVATIIDTLFYSWTALITNGNWLLIVGGLTIFWLILAAVGSILASSEANWEVTLASESKERLDSPSSSRP